jgi:hypothetical protein
LPAVLNNKKNGSLVRLLQIVQPVFVRRNLPASIAPDVFISASIPCKGKQRFRMCQSLNIQFGLVNGANQAATSE